MELNDVYQEVCFAFVNATAGFDPSRGFQFSTYFVNAATNRLRTISKKRSKAVHEVSYDTLMDGGQGEVLLQDILSNPEAPLPDYNVMNEHQRRWMNDRMSLRARVVVKLVNNPPNWLFEGAKDVEARNAMGRKVGLTVRSRQQLVDMDFVLSLLGWKSRKRSIVAELERLVRLANE